MANRTAPGAKTLHGVDPQNLVERIVRKRIYNCQYWKEHCFGINAEGVLDKAVRLETVGGSYGGFRKPSKFVCLILKLLQTQPAMDIVREYIHQPDFKYVRVLGAFYFRLVANYKDVYTELEPLLNDFRKIRVRGLDGKVTISHVDEIVDDLLTQSNVFDCTLPRIPPRHVLEVNDVLQPRISDVRTDPEEEDGAPPGAAPPSGVPPRVLDRRRRSRTRSRSRSRSRSASGGRRRRRGRGRSSSR
eukprot:TRINITY_DN217_c0_g6_i1.p1 TRINITY_DN217_c0_g6~~TRINITY_DN217_c0_g6_i1.p1  ORF type:complete len:245 (+),score=49.52 TRINITY_DN217_c0_g6_i1:87-821(+)